MGMLQRIEDDEGFLDPVIYYDEYKLFVSGKPNKHNCRVLVAKILTNTWNMLWTA
jgi:hypothetical protein